MLELTDLSDGVLVSDMTGMSGEFAFSCNAYGFPFTDMVHHIHLAAGETRNVHFAVDMFDALGRLVIPAVAVLEGADCASATEAACGFGVIPPGYVVPASADVELDGGTAGKDYYLVVGLSDYFGTGAVRAVMTITNLCPSGTLYSPAADACVDNPCLDPNPCVQANKNACNSDVTVAPATYSCGCNVGFVADGAGVCQPNASADGEACEGVIAIPVVSGPGPQIAGTTENAVDDGEGTCSVNPAPDRVYGFTLTQEMRVNITMNPDLGFDGLMHMRTACDDPDSQVACVDVGALGGSEEFSEVLVPGAYYLFVDGWNSRPDPADASGAYTLDYSFYADPCANESTVCPGTPVCHAKADWSGYECVCETPGELFYNGNCVADPCVGVTCGDNTHCTPDLANGTHDCACDAIYVDDGTGGCTVKPDAKWTFMMYWAMDNNLLNQSLPELQDWMNVNYNEDVRLIVLVDPWGQDGYIAEMLPGEMKVVYEFGGSPDTGDWKTLADFGVWVVDHYPAEHYALIPSDHGGAWRQQSQLDNPVLKSICHDEHTDNIIGVANGELAAALTAITNAAGQKLDFLIYDACLMSTWEMAEVGAPFAHYMLASEESQYGFQNYTVWLNHLIDNLDTITLEELGEVFIDTYAMGGHFDSPGNYYAVTAAMTDLARTSDLTAAVSGFADALVAAKSDTFYAHLDQSRIDSQRMEYRYLVDLGDFARNVKKIPGVPANVTVAADALLAALDKAIVYDWANIHESYKELTGATGLSIFLPPAWYAPDYSVSSVYVDSGAIWAQHSTWDEFLKTFSTGTGGACVDYVGTNVSDVLSIDTSYVRNTYGGPYIGQSFLAPSQEIHGVRLAVVKTEADGHEHDGFTVALRNSKGVWIYEPAGYYPVEANTGDVQYICANVWGLEVEPGEQIDLILFGGTPHWAYDGQRFATPISWPLTYAADDTSDPPYAAGDVFFDDGTNGEMPIQDYNQDGIRATLWFEVY
jgi:hypothetical protein